MKNPSYYAIIPASIRYDERLKASEKLMYGEITALAEKEGFCWASSTYFCNLYGVDRSTVSRWISSLKECGYIDVEIVDSTERKIYLVKGMMQKSHRGCDEKVTGGCDEKVTQSNTSTNTTSDLTAPAKQETDDVTFEIAEDHMLTKDIKKRFGNKIKKYDTSLTGQIIEWAEEKMGHKFTSPMKQKGKISIMLSTGFSVEQIKNKWSDMTTENRWAGGFDFGNVCEEIGKMKSDIIGPGVTKIR